MQLRGYYSSGTIYSAGDVALYTDGVVYFLREVPGVAGVPCTDTRYWQKLDQEQAEGVKFAMQAASLVAISLANNLTTSTTGKALDATQGKALKTLITALQTTVGTLGTDVDALKTIVPNSKTLMLGSSTDESTKRFAITVTDDGTISATEVVSE